MTRIPSFIAVGMFALLVCAPGRAQDSPSLGELARQAQKNKTSNPPKKVLTNDDISGGSSSAPALVSPGLGAVPAPAKSSAASSGSANPDSGAAADQAVAHMESVIQALDGMNRPDLVRTALQGVDTNFPGRSAWESKLLSAKQLYVARGRDLVARVKQIQTSAEALQGSHDPNDPRVKDLTVQLQALIRDGTHMDAAFQAVILEGRDLATSAQAH